MIENLANEQGVDASFFVWGRCLPTEVFVAHSAGAECVKLFPVSNLGPGFIKDLLGPLPNSKLIAVGGVGLHNLKSYLQAGAIAAGIGNSLISGKLVKDAGEEEIYLRVKEYVEGCL